MELKLSNVMGGLLIFTILSSLIAGIYSGFGDEYNFTSSYVDDNGKDIITRFEEVNVIDGINTFISGVLSATSGNLGDLVGGLKMIGIGSLKTLFGIITAPVEILGIVTGFYYIPPKFAQIIQVFITLSLVFVLIRYYIGDET